MEVDIDLNMNVDTERHTGLGASGVTKLVKSPSLLALSGLGLAIGSVRRVIYKMSRAVPSLRSLGLPKLPRLLPKYIRSKSLRSYIRSNYVKYPAVFFILLATVRRARSAISQ